jgi:putative transposase
MRKTQFVPGNFYHIYNRGVEKRDIFCEENDYWRFLQALFLFNDERAYVNSLWHVQRTFGRTTFNTIIKFLNKQQRKLLVKINAYCLMPNHYHLILEEIIKGGISRFMHKLGVGYTLYFNNKYERNGVLFQGPFKSVAVETQNQFERLLIYVNALNPAQLVNQNAIANEGLDKKMVQNFIVQYPWSTHQEYLNKRNSIIIEKSLFGQVFDPEKYQEFYLSALKVKELKEKYINPRLFLE